MLWHSSKHGISEVRRMATEQQDQARAKQLAVTLARRATHQQRDDLLAWATQLMLIRDSQQSAFHKARQAINATLKWKAILSLIKSLAAEIKRMGWDERGLPARVGLSSAALIATTLGGQGAGIMALGGILGVPLWVVFGAGGVFAGVLIEEIRSLLPADHRPAEPVTIEGEVIKFTPHPIDPNP